MPTYDYRCAKCGEDLEVYQSFSEKPLTRHKGCGGKLSKVLSPAGIVLKGSGFYKNDSKDSAKSRSRARADASEKSSSTSDGASSSGSDSKSDAKPADTKAKSDTKSGSDGASKAAPSKEKKAPSTTKSA